MSKGPEVAGQFGKIGVLMGGPSSEREISLKSAKAVYTSLSGLGLDVVPIDIVSDDADETARLLRGYGIDCAFVALHGRFGEDGQIQEILESLSIPYTGSGPTASRAAMDKIVSRERFVSAGLHVARGVKVDKESWLRGDNVQPDFPLPWVVKPARQGSSIGMSILESKDGLDQALRTAFGFDTSVIVEEFIAGRELTVGILNDEPLPVIEIVPKSRFFDFQAKYQAGGSEYIVPAKISGPEIVSVQEAALAAHRSLGCFGCSRVDVILRGDGVPFVLELNNIPGMTETSLLPKAARVKGIDFTQLCVILLRCAYEKKPKNVR